MPSVEPHLIPGFSGVWTASGYLTTASDVFVFDSQNACWSSQMYAPLVGVFINHWSYFCIFSGSKAVLYGKSKICANPTIYTKKKQNRTQTSLQSTSLCIKWSSQQYAFRTASSRTLFWTLRLPPPFHCFFPLISIQKTKPASLLPSLKIDSSYLEK